jgi:type II secretory pathway pseudopilin PulG
LYLDTRNTSMFTEGLAAMKPKLMAILVIGILAVSVILTLVGAVNQAVSGEASAPDGRALSLAEDGAGIGDGQDSNALVRSFNFVCPFH